MAGTQSTSRSGVLGFSLTELYEKVNLRFCLVKCKETEKKCNGEFRQKNEDLEFLFASHRTRVSGLVVLATSSIGLTRETAVPKTLPLLILIWENNLW